MELTAKIRRYNPEKDDAPHWETYEVPAEPDDSALSLLLYVKWHLVGLPVRRVVFFGVVALDLGG